MKASAKLNTNSLKITSATLSIILLLSLSLISTGCSTNSGESSNNEETLIESTTSTETSESPIATTESEETTTEATTISEETEVIETTTEETKEERDYILNTNSKKIHKPSCSSVSSMKEKNKKEVHGTLDEFIEQGYEGCGNCHPV